jgi:hypothetical protein
MVSVLSLITAAGMCAMWIRSYWYWDEIVYSIPAADDRPNTFVWRGWQRSAASERGHILLTSKSGGLWTHYRNGWGVTRLEIDWPPVPPRSPAGFLGSLRIQWESDFIRATPYHFHIRKLVFPYWCVTAILALPVMLRVLIAPRIFRSWRAGQFESVRCTVCGYDLRATPDRCPECGVKAPFQSN